MLQVPAMLSLESPRWSELEHAYGQASDIPPLLRQLQDLPGSVGQSEPWFTLWGSLALRATSIQRRSQRSRVSLPLWRRHRQKPMRPFSISLRGWKSAGPSRGRRFRLTWRTATLRLFCASLRWWQKPLPGALIQTLLHAQQLPSQPPWGSTRWPRSFLKCRPPDSRLRSLNGSTTVDS